jgi:deazaflavin-dependent oxidoreductase (nitroreductase family)
MIKYTGRKSGKVFITPLCYADIGGEVVVCASKGGADHHPAWYLNVVDAPEIDFDVLAPGTEVHVQALAIHRDFVAKIARRAPAADLATRTVHLELDVADANRELPVGTTADVRIDVGEPEAATEIPLAAATVRGNKATLFVVDQGTAHKKTFPVKGERAGRLYVDTSLAPGSRVVTEGRALLNDKDKVTASLEQAVLQASAVPPAKP